MTPARFAAGMTFEDYVRFTGSPEKRLVTAPAR